MNKESEKKKENKKKKKWKEGATTATSARTLESPVVQLSAPLSCFFTSSWLLKDFLIQPFSLSLSLFISLHPFQASLLFTLLFHCARTWWLSTFILPSHFFFNESHLIVTVIVDLFFYFYLQFFFFYIYIFKKNIWSEIKKYKNKKKSIKSAEIKRWIALEHFDTHPRS